MSALAVPIMRDRELHSYQVFTDYQHATWEMRHIPWDDFDPDEVRPEHIVFVKSVIVGESNSVAALHGLLNEFADDYDFSAFASIWGYQEFQHHLAFMSWLRLAGHDVPYRKINAMREAYPPGVTRAASLATNIICEVLANHAYKCVSRAVTEPVLAKILKRASGDEARHAREFQHYCARRLETNPEEMGSVLETLYLYMGGSRQLYRHPVSRFKGDLPEVEGTETVDEMFAYWADVDHDDVEWNRCCAQLFDVFSKLTGRPLTKMADVRRAIAEVSA